MARIRKESCMSHFDPATAWTECPRGKTNTAPIIEHKEAPLEAGRRLHQLVQFVFNINKPIFVSVFIKTLPSQLLFQEANNLLIIGRCIIHVPSHNKRIVYVVVFYRDGFSGTLLKATSSSAMLLCSTHIRLRSSNPISSFGKTSSYICVTALLTA